MCLIKSLENSDCWKSDLLCMSDTDIADVLVCCAELSMPYVYNANIKNLMPSIRRWYASCDSSDNQCVASALLKYIFDSGLYSTGGKAFLDLPVAIWPIVLNETMHSLAEECLLEAAKSIATIGRSTFFGTAGHCIDCAERCLEMSEQLTHELFKERILNCLRVRMPSW